MGFWVASWAGKQLFWGEHHQRVGAFIGLTCVLHGRPQRGSSHCSKTSETATGRAMVVQDDQWRERIHEELTRKMANSSAAGAETGNLYLIHFLVNSVSEAPSKETFCFRVNCGSFSQIALQTTLERPLFFCVGTWGCFCMFSATSHGAAPDCCGRALLGVGHHVRSHAEGADRHRQRCRNLPPIHPARTFDGPRERRRDLDSLR